MPLDIDGCAAVAAEYGRRWLWQRDEAERQLRRFRNWAACRSLTVGLIIGLALLSEKEQPQVRIGLLLIPALVAILLMLGRRRAGRAWDRAMRASGYYEERLACLDGTWVGRGEPGTRYLVDDHPAALDLDLFGSGSLYERLCAARTRPGQDTLAAWLSGPADAAEVHTRQAAVGELRSCLDLCEDLAVRGTEIPAQERLAVLAHWGREAAMPWSLLARLTVVLGPTLALALVAVWALTGTGAVLPLIAVALQVGIAVRMHRHCEQVLRPPETARATLRPLARLLDRLQGQRFVAPRLRELSAMLHAGRRPAARMLAQLDRLMGWAVPATLLGCRPLLALLLDTWRRRHGGEVGRCLEALGGIEALASLATYARENPDAVFPEVVPAGFDAEGLGHPLLPACRCVGNDVKLVGEPGLLMVSGSNMAGKSTLLRAVGVNAVLALAGAPVRARRLRLAPLVIGATLRVQDSLRAGRSRFYAEALRVRRLLEVAAGPRPLLFLLDELFQGTNSHDRRVGAEAVLRRLLDHDAIGLVTTHDLALTDIAERLAPRAVHFEDHGGDGALAFDYRLRPGVVPSSNGLALLRAVGIEV